VIKGNQPVWTSRVVVGKRYHESPIFKADMRSIVFNPTWAVPQSIAANELLPKLRANRGYLAAQHMVLLDGAGNSVDPGKADLSSSAASRYALRQEPGPWNALGQVKFLFPNEHAVHLHDTPSRQLFASEVRAFSHGCIRVENPIDLAALLLA